MIFVRTLVCIYLVSYLIVFLFIPDTYHAREKRQSTYGNAQSLLRQDSFVFLYILQELEDLRRKYMTKKGPVQKVMGQMRLLSNEDKASAVVQSAVVSCGAVPYG